MAERKKGLCAAYKKYKLITRIIAAFIGAIAGVSGCILFAKVYQNYHAATWAAISAVFAIVFLRLNFSVRRDHERLISRETFVITLSIGFMGFVAGFIGFITYLVLGITHHESGMFLVHCLKKR